MLKKTIPSNGSIRQRKNINYNTKNILKKIVWSKCIHKNENHARILKTYVLLITKKSIKKVDINKIMCP